jgi:hypothetical protein
MDSKPTTYLIRNVKHIAKVVDFLWSFKQNKKWGTKTWNETLDSCETHSKKRTHCCKKTQKQKHMKYETSNITSSLKQSFEIDFETNKVQRCKAKCQKEITMGSP